MNEYLLLKDIWFCDAGRIFYRSVIDFGETKRIIYITKDKPYVSIFEDEIKNVDEYFRKYEW